MKKKKIIQVTYIVAAIALREGPEGREVLLMREAKEKCRGKWYIPAGHVEPGETIEVIYAKMENK